MLISLRRSPWEDSQQLRWPLQWLHIAQSARVTRLLRLAQVLPLWLLLQLCCFSAINTINDVYFLVLAQSNLIVDKPACKQGMKQMHLRTYYSLFCIIKKKILRTLPNHEHHEFPLAHKWDLNIFLQPILWFRRNCKGHKPSTWESWLWNRQSLTLPIM